MRARPVLPAIRAANQRARTPVADRFWAKVDRRDTDACWLWTAHIGEWGYGIINLGGRTFIASRVAWALTNGEPGDQLVCHTCDNPACCNPAHLWLGTDGDNHRDMMAKGRHRANGVKGERHMWTKLTEEQVRDIKTSLLMGKELALKYGVCRSTISEIRSGRNWAWLKPPGETGPADSRELADAKAARVARLYLAGASAREVASELSIPHYCGIYPLLKRAGVTYRHRPEANNRRAAA